MQYDTFFCYNRQDQFVVEKLANYFVKSGLQIFFDKWHLIPGEQIHTRLVNALSNCDTVLVCVGPLGLGKWQKDELAVAIQLSNSTRNRLKVIPVLLPGSKIEDLDVFLATRECIDFRTDISSLGLSRLYSSIRSASLIKYLDQNFENSLQNISLPNSKLNENGDLKDRLNKEAMFLSNLGFDVELKYISGGFGLSLPLGEKITLGYFIPLNFPLYPPKVVISINGQTKEITLEKKDWNRDITLADVTATILESMIQDM